MRFIYVLAGAALIAFSVAMCTRGGRSKIQSHVNDLRQIDRTEDVSNRIASNSFFEASYAEIRATAFKVRSCDDPAEKTQLSYVLADQVAEYNSRARTMTKGEWRAMDLPYQIDMDSILTEVIK